MKQLNNKKFKKIKDIKILISLINNHRDLYRIKLIKNFTIDKILYKD